jgi:hypothetical protein
MEIIKKFVIKMNMILGGKIKKIILIIIQMKI